MSENSSMQELITRVFAIRDAAHLAHWAAKGPGSFARHSALGDFYDGIIDKLDGIVEAYQGAFGLIQLDLNLEITPKDLDERIKDEVNWLQENRSEIAGGIAAIENMIDDLAGLYLTTFYKLKNLA